MKKHTRKSNRIEHDDSSCSIKAQLEAYRKVCAALAPLTQDRRIKVVKAAAIMLGVDIN